MPRPRRWHTPPGSAAAPRAASLRRRSSKSPPSQRSAAQRSAAQARWTPAAAASFTHRVVEQHQLLLLLLRKPPPVPHVSSSASSVQRAPLTARRCRLVDDRWRGSPRARALSEAARHGAAGWRRRAAPLHHAASGRGHAPSCTHALSCRASLTSPCFASLRRRLHLRLGWLLRAPAGQAGGRVARRVAARPRAPLQPVAALRPRRAAPARAALPAGQGGGAGARGCRPGRARRRLGAASRRSLGAHERGWSRRALRSRPLRTRAVALQPRLRQAAGAPGARLAATPAQRTQP